MLKMHFLTTLSSLFVARPIHGLYVLCGGTHVYHSTDYVIVVFYEPTEDILCQNRQIIVKWL